MYFDHVQVATATIFIAMVALVFAYDMYVDTRSAHARLQQLIAENLASAIRLRSTYNLVRSHQVTYERRLVALKRYVRTLEKLRRKRLVRAWEREQHDKALAVIVEEINAHPELGIRLWRSSARKGPRKYEYNVREHLNETYEAICAMEDAAYKRTGVHLDISVAKRTCSEGYVQLAPTAEVP